MLHICDVINGQAMAFVLNQRKRVFLRKCSECNRDTDHFCSYVIGTDTLPTVLMIQLERFRVW